MQTQTPPHAGNRSPGAASRRQAALERLTGYYESAADFDDEESEVDLMVQLSGLVRMDGFGQE